MPRTYYSYLPVLVAGVVFTLASTPVRAQRPEQPSAEPATHACACCGNSGAAAMKHDADGGCCGNMTMHAMPGTAMADPAAAHNDQTDHAAMNHEAAADHAAMGHDMPAASADHKMAGGCCDQMAMDHTADKADATAMKHDAAAGCCGNMAMNMKMDAGQPPAKAADASAMFGATTGCPTGAADTTAKTADSAKPMDHGAAGCCAAMAGMHAPAK